MVLPPQEVDLLIQSNRHDRRMVIVALSWGAVFLMMGHLFWVGALHRTFPNSYTLRKLIDACFFLPGVPVSIFIYSRIPVRFQLFALYASLVTALLSISVLFLFPF